METRAAHLRAANAQPDGGEEAVLSGPDAIVNGEVLVKHVLSKELQLYYDKIVESIVSENDNISSIAVASLSKDTGIQPLLPYLVQFMTHTVSLTILLFLTFSIFFFC